MLQPPPNPDKRLARKKAARRRLYAYGGLLAAAWGFWVWQPYNYDLFPKQPPTPNPPIDPDSKLLFSPKARVLLVTAHPDDSAFYIGGFLTQLGRSGAQIFQVLCTDGDKGYYPFEDWRTNRAKRRVEAVNEAKVWNGRQVWFLSEPDGRLKADQSVVDEIAAVIQQVKPDYVVCFDGVYPPRMSHSDHRRSGEAATEAAKKTGIPKWILHFSTEAPNFVVDISDNWNDQQNLLAIHESQFYGERLDRVANMVHQSAERDGMRIGKPLAEGFRVERLR